MAKKLKLEILFGKVIYYYHLSIFKFLKFNYSSF
jgi:hypothetical protein